MADINIDYEMIGEQGTVIKKISSEIREELNKIYEGMKNVNNVWKSPAQSVIENNVRDTSIKVENFYKELDGYSNFLSKTAEAYGYVEKKIKSNADNFMS